MYGEVLCKDEYQTSVNRTRTGYHTVAQELLLLHAEVVATMLFEHVVLFERTFIKQHLNTFACSIFTFVVLLLYGFFTTTETSLFALLDKFLNLF